MAGQKCGYNQSLGAPQSISGPGTLSIMQHSSQCLRLLKPDISVSLSDGASFIGQFFSRRTIIACWVVWVLHLLWDNGLAPSKDLSVALV